MARSVDDFVIDFNKEDKGAGGGIRVKPGTYRMKILKAAAITSAEKGTPGLQLTVKFMTGPKSGKTATETLYATPKAYARFRSLLEAVGKKVPQRVNLKKIATAVTGEELFMEWADEEREGYATRSRVTFEGFFSEDDYDGDDDTDEDDDPDDEDDDLEDDDEEEEDEDDEPEPPKRKRRSAAKKPPARKRRRPADDDEDDEDDDELDLDDL